MGLFSTLKIKERDLRFNINPNVIIPKFEEIGHKDIMTFFVKKYVKDTRKILFDILKRKYDFVSLFVSKIKKLGLYNLFEEKCLIFYGRVFDDWKKEHNID